MTASTTTSTLSAERTDLIETLQTHRAFLRFTVRDLTHEQATSRPTVSELTLAGLVKHVSFIEASWARFAVEGPSAFAGEDGSVQWAEAWGLADGETLADVLDTYAEVARRTDELVATLDLDAARPLPEAPWSTPGAMRTVRRTFLHVVAETAQHAGHADVLRESIDGQKTMG